MGNQSNLTKKHFRFGTIFWKETFGPYECHSCPGTICFKSCSRKGQAGFFFWGGGGIGVSCSCPPPPVFDLECSVEQIVDSFLWKCSLSLDLSLLQFRSVQKERESTHRSGHVSVVVSRRTHAAVGRVYWPVSHRFPFLWLVVLHFVGTTIYTHKIGPLVGMVGYFPSLGCCLDFRKTVVFWCWSEADGFLHLTLSARGMGRGDTVLSALSDTGDSRENSSLGKKVDAEFQNSEPHAQLNKRFAEQASHTKRNQGTDFVLHMFGFDALQKPSMNYLSLSGVWSTWPLFFIQKRLCRWSTVVSECSQKHSCVYQKSNRLQWTTAEFCVALW